MTPGGWQVLPGLWFAPYWPCKYMRWRIIFRRYAEHVGFHAPCLSIYWRVR